MSERADFDRLIAEALSLDRVILTGTQARESWADEIEQDDEAREAFTDYIAGKNQEHATYDWGGQVVTRGPDDWGPFLDRYGNWVDWRAEDIAMVEYFARRLKRPRLALGPSTDALDILFGESTRTLTFEQIGKERYVTLRVLAPAWLWTHLEDHDGRKLRRKFRAIGPGDRFR